MQNPGAKHKRPQGSHLAGRNKEQRNWRYPVANGRIQQHLDNLLKSSSVPCRGHSRSRSNKGWKVPEKRRNDKHREGCARSSKNTGIQRQTKEHKPNVPADELPGSSQPERHSETVEQGKFFASKCAVICRAIHSFDRQEAIPAGLNQLAEQCTQIYKVGRVSQDYLHFCAFYSDHEKFSKIAKIASEYESCG